MKKCLVKVVLMVRVKKYKLERDDWSTSKLTETPIFGKLMSRLRTSGIF
jgi:hypothetical protein